ncbi:MAG: class I SAM-dependent methyltransferase [Gammaproteobacteria bacterium]|nr:class I SAM-dependent methyltransferase [Gammaproteobacteria bacterium]
MNRRIAAFSALAMTAALCVHVQAPGQTTDAEASAALDAAIAGDHRSDRNRARDRYRHPKETLQFFGFRPDMTVVEIWPGAGWYTEILAPALREQGKLYVAQYGEEPPFDYQQREMQTLEEKLSGAPEVYGDVTLTALDFSEGSGIAPSGSADLVVTFRNVHNWFDEGYGPPDAPAIAFAAMYDALKPGGVLGVVDHRWPDPASEDPAAGNGYVSEERVIDLAEEAGFELAGRSDVNRNPFDTHDHPAGVWTLPPDLALRDRDRDKYLEIGESDRFTLKFVKPAD